LTDLQENTTLCALVNVGLERQTALQADLDFWQQDAAFSKQDAAHWKMQAQKDAKVVNLLVEMGAVLWLAEEMAKGKFGAEGVGAIYRAAHPGQRCLESPLAPLKLLTYQPQILPVSTLPPSQWPSHSAIKRNASYWKL
jgi:hypothetical protein